ncbi:MAG TPA: DNA primase [Longimicrobium sp.]|nr:DNA primase [Longimicrobium sp.]
MPIPDHLVEEVRQRADIVEIVSEHTRLKRSGRTFRGPCPLHGGEGPNFSVDPAKGFYKCFVCGEGGSAFTFLQKHLGMSFPEAVRHVAARVGIDIPDEDQERQQDDPNRVYYDVNALAADWFRKQLWETDGGKAARAYLERRGISREAAERFRLGWAPEAWTAFGDYARETHRIDNALLLALGLVKEGKTPGREPYDVFRGRVIFPIEDLSGRVVAFGGRILGEAEPHIPKYLNSPETPVYHKGLTLYGLGWAKGAIRREETALVVEGYMDYVSLAAHGVENAVAPLGTAMTEEQAELIARYTKRAILLYDSDKAGLKATFRSGDALLRAGVEVGVATLPDGEDPDSLVRAKGPAALKRYLNDAVDVLERKIQILERRDFFSSIKGTRQAIDSLLPTVRAASDEVLRGVYINRIAEKTGVPRATLEKEAAELPAPDLRASRGPERGPGQGSTQGQGHGPGQAPWQDYGQGPWQGQGYGQGQGSGRRNGQGYGDRRGRGRGQPQGPVEDAPAPPRATAWEYPEKILLLLMLRDESWVERAAQVLSPHDFHNADYQAVYAGLIEAEGRRDPDRGWLEVFPVELRRRVEDLLDDPEGASLAPADKFFEGSLNLIHARALQVRLEEVERKLLSAGPDQQLSLFREKRVLVGQMRSASGYLRKAGLKTLYTTDRPYDGTFG